MSPRTYVQILSETEPGDLVWLAASSAMSTRLCDPGARRVLLIDPATQVQLDAAARAALEQAFTEIVQVETPHPAGALASRHLKTRLRDLVEGDLLFLDIDTLMVEVPTALFSGSHDVAAAYDRNHERRRPHRPTWVVPHYKSLGWKFSRQGYFNTGVLFMRESPAARRLGKDWHQRWQAFFDHTGKHQDQPAFNSLLDDPSLHLKPLPLHDNAMVDACPFFCWRARIVHYFLHGGRRLVPAESVLWTLAREWREQGSFNRARFEHCRRHKDPWVHPTRSVQIELATGHFVTAAKLILNRLTPGAKPTG